MEKKGRKRFGMLMCAEDSEHVKKLYGGYFGVFMKMLKEENETWDMYKVSCGEFPKDNELNLYDGFVITGSCSDAFGNDKWISDLVNLIKKLDSMHTKILGICFGHQVLGRALGGKVGPSPTGWDIGVRNITLSPNICNTSLNLPQNLSIIKCHRDEIQELPKKAKVIGCSEKNGIEMFKYENHIMGIQGHPEYSKDILLNLIDRLIRQNSITERFGEEARKNVDLIEPNIDVWSRFCNSFLKSRS